MRGTALLKLAQQCKLWPENDSEWLREELCAIPDDHTAHLKRFRIVSDFDDYMSEKLQPFSESFTLTWEEIAGCYHWNNWELRVKSQSFGPGLVSHEMGHHVLNQHLHEWPITFMSFLVPEYARYRLIDPGPLHPDMDWKEFFAEVYMLFAAQGQNYWKGHTGKPILGEEVYNSNLLWCQRTFPTLSDYMAVIFEGRGIR